MIEWTEEEIAKRSADAIKALRGNALRLGQQHVVDLCDTELNRRKPSKPLKLSRDQERRAGFYVSEFHFVCPNELGVTKNSDGTLSTGIWVVDAANAEAAEKYGSVVALHATRAEPSYLQGKVKGWQKKPRERKYSGDQLTKTMTGIEFLIEPTRTPLVWQGDATGEKGYAWSPIPK
jgi:hypothetical protein